ncbi:MFS transporter [Pendulispora albinea]|uniref:MFS transporter n=1 Tax=Pendulispora albinea TaxID=2741071 RepID=A0ABZ2LPN8_9BACT
MSEPLPTRSARPTVGARMDRLPITRTHRMLTLAVGLGLFFDVYEVFLAGVLGQVLVREFHLPKTWLPMLLGSGFLGMAIGATLLGRFADRLGRRKAFLVGLWAYSLFSFVGAFSVGPVMLLVTRFLAGIGIGAEPPLADAYLGDLLPAKERGRYIAWAYTVGFLGVPTAGFLAHAMTSVTLLGISGWRWMFVIGALGTLVLYPLRRRLPESPRWLESTGRHEEADRWVSQLEAEAGGARSPEPEPPPSPRPPRGDLRELWVPPYRRRMVMMTVFQLLQPFAYYGFGTLVPLVLTAKGYSVVKSLLFSGITFIGYPLGSLLSSWILDRVERKYVVAGALFGMGLFGTAFGHATATPWILTLGFLYTATSNVFSNGFHVYQAELFPTSLRGVACGGTYALSRLSNAAMPFLLVPLLDTRGVGALFAVIVTMVVINGLNVALLGPRTTGRSLEHI